MATHWSTALERLNACDDAVKWALTQPSLAVAWRNCERGDWMLWLLARLDADRPTMVRAAACCAELALPYAGETEPECMAAIQAAVGWADGELSIEVVDAAGAAADAAADAAYAARSRTLSQCADIARAWFPCPPRMP
jgi:hypothetical protein